MPLVSRTFDQLIDFTRTSAATYVDASGRIVPTPASRNLLTFTQEFDNEVHWGKDYTTVTANAATAPDGTLTADKLIETTDNNIHFLFRDVTTAATPYTWSCYLKAAERTFAILYHSQSNTGVSVNLLTGQIGTPSGTDAPTSSSATNVGNGWYRVTMTATATAASNSFRVYLATSLTGSASYAGNGTSGIFIWGAQLEAGSTLTDYTRNVGGVYPPRFDYDPVTLAPRGLLVEEQRTNLLTYSQDWTNAAWSQANITATAEATTSPDGTVNAQKLVETATTGIHFAAQAAATATSTAYTFSIYLKSAERSTCRLYMGNSGGTEAVMVDVDTTAGTLTTVSNAGTNWTSRATTISNAGNGWWRVTLSATNASLTSVIGLVYMANPAGTIAYTGDGTSGIYIWGAQLEAGSFATSYIPTVASQVTRTADVATITGANFSQWYNQSEGTFVAQFDMIGGSAANTNNQIVLSPIADASNRHIIYNADAQIAGYTVVGGVTQAYLPMGSLAANTTSKMAYAYQVNNFAASQNGGAVSTDTSGSLPVPTLLGIGSGGLGGNQLNGHIRSIRYYPTRLSNAQLQALTA